MEVKERIIEEATEMFFKSGIKAITMDDIARELGISKRTLYEIFKDKDDLLKKCLKYMDEKFEREYELIVLESDNAISEVLGLLRLGIYAIKTINPLFGSDMKKYHFQIYNEVLKVNQEKQITQIKTILKKGIGQGLFRDNIDMEVVGILLNEQLKIISDETVFPEQKFSKVVVFENVVISFFRGISTQKGIELIDRYFEKESDFFVTG